MTRILFVPLLIILFSSGSYSSILSDCVCADDNSTLTSFSFDDEILRKLKNEVELLNSSNEILRLRLEMITTRLDQQTETLNKLSSSIFPSGNCGNEPVIDIRSSFQSKPENYTSKKEHKYPNSCAEAAAITRKSGLYTIQLDLFGENPFLVSCNEETQGGGWTVIQRRLDGTVDFYRNWMDYKVGFGNLEGEFFIGLDKLHAMTTATPQELLIVMTDFDGATKFAKYTAFAIGDESESYALNVLGAYSGDAGDSFTYHISQKFTTNDKKNDVNDGNCAVIFKGAWWYKNCHSSNLNGLYLKGTYEKDKYAQGVDWSEWRGHYYSLKTVQMLIRPKRS